MAPPSSNYPDQHPVSQELVKLLKLIKDLLTTLIHARPTIDDLVPEPAVYGIKDNGVSIGKWRIQMLLKFRAMDGIEGVNEHFKANYALSHMTGPAFEQVHERYRKISHGVYGYNSAKDLLDGICDGTA